MKIVIICGSFPGIPCGVGDYTSKLALALAEANPSIHIDIITGADNRIETKDYPCIKFHQIDGWGLRRLSRLISTLKLSAADIVHIQYPAKGFGMGLSPNLLPLAMLILLPNIPIVVTLHEFIMAHPLRKLSEILLLAIPDRIIVCDAREQRIVDRLIRFRHQKMVLQYLASNIPALSQHVPRRVDSEGLTLGYFGFLDKTKDIPLLLDILARLNKDTPFVRLLLIGGITEEEKKKLKMIAKVKRASEHLIFTGFCLPEEISHYLANCDIAIFPFRDGVSMRRASFLAAMQHGLPTIVTYVSDYLPEGLVDGENVLLTKIGDVETITAAVARLSSDIDLRMKLSVNAKIWASLFNWPTIALAHMSLYQEIIDKKLRED